MRKESSKVLNADAVQAASEIKAAISERKNNSSLGRVTFRCPSVGGLEIRVSSSSASWALLYNVKIGDKWAKRRIQIGSFDAFTVGNARKRANELKVEVASGADPANNKKELAQQRQQKLDEAVSINDLFTKWINSASMTSRKGGIEEPSRMIKKDVLPAIGKLDVKEVTGRHLITLRDAIGTRGSRIANVTLALVRQMLGYAVDNFIIEELPKFPTKLKENKPCDRSLSIGEIVELFGKIPAAKLTNTTELALKIQLATACRIGELLIAEWHHVCLDSGEWVIPASNSKTGAELTVYLSTYARSLFKRLHELSGYQKWIYPNRDETNHMDTKNIAKQVKDRQRLEVIAGRSSTPDALILAGGTWTPHDLRRTAASTMQDLRINPYTIERCLNHAADKMARTYVPNNPEIEMYQAWQALGEVLEICDSSKGLELAQLAEDNKKRSVQNRLTLSELLLRINSNVIPLRKEARA